MPRKSLACLVVGLVLASLLWGQAPPDKKTEKPADKPAEKTPDKPAIDPAIERLVEQLTDLDYHKRDEAARKLEALGEKALPALRAAKKHKDPEVRRRAADLLEPIESATVLAPKRVTLTLEKKTAAEALQAIGKQTGYTVELMAGGKAEGQYSFRWKDVPFWQAVDDVCRAAGLSAQQQFFFGDDHVRLQAQGRYAPHVCQAGAFCVAAGGFQETKTIEFSAVPLNNPEATRTNEMVFAFWVHAEPRLPLLSLGEPHISAAYDDQGNSMIPPPGAAREQPNQQLFGYRPGRAYYGGQRMLSLTSQVNLVRPSPKATAVKQLKGSVPATILLEQKSQTITDNLAGAKGKKVQAGSTTFVIEELSETPGTKQVQLRLAISEDPNSLNGPNDYTWMNSLWSRLQVFDDKGQQLNSNGSSWGGAGGNHVTMTMTYPAGSKPTKLVYQVWTTLSCHIAFEFQGLPLP
jgi:hypothetical protein